MDMMAGELAAREKITDSHLSKVESVLEWIQSQLVLLGRPPDPGPSTLSPKEKPGGLRKSQLVSYFVSGLQEEIKAKCTYC